MSYDPATYWADRGRGYEQEMLDKGWWAAENPELIELLETLEFGTVLDVGCGFGRVGASILSRWPDIEYTGVDVSPDLIDGARRRLPASAELICADLATWQFDKQWDLVLAVSTLGHIRPEDIGGLLERMQGWAKRDLVHIDWDEPGASTSFQYGHPYRQLHEPAVEIPMGRQTLFHLSCPTS